MIWSRVRSVVTIAIHKDRGAMVRRRGKLKAWNRDLRISTERRSNCRLSTGSVAVQ